MAYHLVTVFNIPDQAAARWLESAAFRNGGCLGIEEYSLNEAEVDELLGARSYSGGDLPIEVLQEVDEFMHRGDFHCKYFFEAKALGEAKQFLEEISKNFLCESQIETLEDADWNSEWKKHYHAIPVSDELVILPEWYDKAKHPEKYKIRIHPGMGFGTGSHETTYLCLKQFCRLVPMFAKSAEFLDYGSGSGILGLTALLMVENSTVTMVDIDLEAHRNCLQNMELNSINEARVKMSLLEDRPELPKRFPLVFANILQNILLEEKKYLSDILLPDGFLILSGLLQHQMGETLKAYLGMGLVLDQQETKGDWGCIVLRRPA